MTYLGRVLADRPYAIWSLDDSTPFNDDGGSNRLGEMITSGDYVSAPSLVSGGGLSAQLSNTKNARWFFPGFQPGRERKSFTLEAWVQVRNSTEPVAILSHASDTDGLWYEDGVVGFTTKYVGPTVATASYKLPEAEAYHLVGVHTEYKNSLYVNGVLVADVDITEEQNSTGYFVHTDADYLFSGYSSAPGTMVMDSPAVYGYALNSSQIQNHYSWGRNVLSSNEIVNQFGGTWFDMTDSTADTYMKRVWNTDSDWYLGYPAGVVIRNDKLFPDVNVAGEAIAGEWLASVNLSSLDETTTIDSARVYWEGSGDFSVYVSTDGTETFTEITSGQLLPGISNNYSTVNKSVEINVRFDSGAGNTEANVSSITFVGYKSNSFYGSDSSRTATFNGSVTPAISKNEPIEYNVSRGATFSGGTVDVSIDITETPNNADVLEIWFKLGTLTGAQTILDARATGQTSKPYLRWSGSAMQSQGFTTTYVNGNAVTLGSYTFTAGVWYHLVLVLTTPANDSYRIGSSYLDSEDMTGNVGGFGIYIDSLSSSDVLSLYNAYFGVVTNRVNESSAVVLTEQPTAYNIYDYDWSITPAGL